MASWRAIEAEAPELAARALTFFDAFTHKTIATLRRDGSPRISGTEAQFRADITELVVVRLAEPADHLVVESWHEGKGVTRRERR